MAFITLSVPGAGHSLGTEWARKPRGDCGEWRTGPEEERGVARRSRRLRYNKIKIEKES